ncbi:MAG: hypothetical protein EOO82_03980 [Oxalobacteraceae bacterium]|nr:MAG: hypothetical protein EOO82_03980 [Oxalobacteraceae bacterium]
MADPGKPDNHILRFQLKSPNVRDGKGRADKGRIQLNVYGNRGVREVRARMRMRLGTGLTDVREYPGAVQWLTISEWWNDGDWSRSPFPFRISVNVAKTGARAGAPLHFSAHAQTFDRSLNKWTPTLWKETDESFEVPIGVWMTLEYFWREGDAAHGRFVMTVTPNGRQPHSVFKVKGWTQHPAAVKPNGLANFNPAKLYTSRDVVNFVRERGKALEIDWDDLDLSLCTTPGTSLCAISAEGGMR